VQQATEHSFLAMPSSVPDGKGVIGFVGQAGSKALVYVPLSVPLADVVNAWMFTEGSADQLHRPDSFVAPQPGVKGSRVAAYRWNGFGFDGIANERCEARLD
jgi:hypothetical protein